jgi:hypothetical protein
MRMLVDSSDDQRIADPSLLRIIARAHNVHGRLSQNTKLTVHDIAREEGVTAAYLFNLLRLPWLAPDITTAIVNGRPPHQLNAKVLMRKAPRLPADWLRSACCSDSKGLRCTATTSSRTSELMALRTLVAVPSASNPSTTKWPRRDFRCRARPENAHICLCGLSHARNARQLAAKSTRQIFLQYQ